MYRKVWDQLLSRLSKIGTGEWGEGGTRCSRESQLGCLRSGQRKKVNLILGDVLATERDAQLLLGHNIQS